MSVMASSVGEPQRFTSIVADIDCKWSALMVWATFRAKHRRVRQRVFRRTFTRAEAGMWAGTYWVIEDVTWRARVRLTVLRDAAAGAPRMTPRWTPHAGLGTNERSGT